MRVCRPLHRTRHGREVLEKYEINRWFIEKASGKDTNRPKLQEMLEYVREDDAVYVEEFSRLG